MTRGDRILAFLLAVMAIAAIPLAAGASDDVGSGLTIVGPYGRTMVDPAVDDSVIVEGLHGDVAVRIEDGTVCVTESSCPDQVCVHTRPIGPEGGVIACVPNGVTITLGGETGGGLDAVVR